MATDYHDYKPMVLQNVSVELLKSAQYERFIHSAATEPGIRLLLHRHRLRPDWPYIDTKFNPNTGADLPPAAYNVVYAWFLGRGTEALVEHLPVIESLAGLAPVEKDEANKLLRRMIASMVDAIVRMMAANQGRCVFRINRDFKAVDEGGQTIAADPNMRSASDTFCAKGLVAEGSPGSVARGVRMMLDCGRAAEANAYGSEQNIEQADRVSFGGRMLMQAAALLVCRKTADPRLRRDVLDMVAHDMEFVLDRFYDPATGLLPEFIHSRTGQRLTYLDPGHSNEFVGLGLSAVEAMESPACRQWLTPERKRLLARARAEMPRILLKSCQVGWNHRQHGLHKVVDTATGRPINDDMPWWNLPETMRAAARALEVTADPAVRGELLEWFRLCHNAYFEHYLNRDKMLFPFQTRSGATGRVVDKVPAVPEGDPLYHTNLSLLEMLEVIQRLR